MLHRCGFDEKWIGWIRACVFAGNLSVLVNGSPTGEINIQRGLKQGDPLAPFLFLIVAEGLSGVMRNAVDVGLFKGFSVGREPLDISLLQYADDTLCIGDASVENLWTLKAILGGFEMASGLKVNFLKSCLIGVNVISSFMEMACTFLNCREGSIPFKYLGLPIGANPKSEVTWKPLLDNLRKRLFSWRNKYISFGGRIVLINAVLNSMPIFYLSFLKIPVSVRKKVIRIQREFLWGGVKGGRKVSWIKWSVICKEKEKGGLGVRDIHFVNLSLLAKWRWRLLLPGRSLWKDVLIAKYGNQILFQSDLSVMRAPSWSSNWWKNIIALDNVIPGKKWFVDSMVRKVGDGRSTRFWTTKWIGDVTLAIAFPRLFSLSNQKDSMVSDFIDFEDGRRVWSFMWRRNLFQWEEDLVVILRGLLDPWVFSLEEDEWSWLPEVDDGFSVRSAYKLLLDDLGAEVVVDEALRGVLAQIWSSVAPSKVIAFSWQLLHDRIPTRNNLELRGILVLEAHWECVGSVETPTHLFLHCPCAMKVWSELFKWVGVEMVIPPSISSLFEIFMGSARNAKIRKGFALIWHASLWAIWKERNSAIFSTGVFNPLVVVDLVKVLSWKWALSRLKIAPCLFYEWNWDPGDCLLRTLGGRLL
ncbi:hypothetical protein QL285_038202 [Trifolium repens]|nr:hypothetical protein QL285_038202 [Trifolium repens]